MDGGYSSAIGKKVSEPFSIVDTIDLDILFSLKDKAGPNSIEFVDQLGTPYNLFDNRNIRTVKPMTEAKHVEFKSGFSTKTFRFDTPDQLTLPKFLLQKVFRRGLHMMTNTPLVFYHLWCVQDFGELLIGLFSKNLDIHYSITPVLDDN